MSDSDASAGRSAAERSELLELATGFYRDEMRRTVAWRDRLDRTSNWAVVLSASILTFAFSSPDNPHYILLVAMAAVTVFLLIEARRFRHYDIWRSRVRLLEANLFAPAFGSQSPREEGWWSLLAADLESPRYRMSFLEACRHRLRRVYLPLLWMIGPSWVARITAFEPGPLDIRADAAIGDVPGVWVIGLVAGFYAVVTVFAFLPLPGRDHREPHDDGRAGDSWGARED